MTGAAAPLEGRKSSGPRKPCEFYFHLGGKRGPCTRQNCPHSHKEEDLNAYLKVHPNTKAGDRSTWGAKLTGGSGTGSGGGSSGSGQTSRGRPTQRTSSQGSLRSGSGSRRTAAASTGNPNPPKTSQSSSRSTSRERPSSFPPSNACRYHVMHVGAGAGPCTRKDCTFPHPTSLTKEDAEWVKQRARRADSPARQAGGRSDRRNTPSPKGSKSSGSR